jgi:hypothetical protein
MVPRALLLCSLLLVAGSAAAQLRPSASAPQVEPQSDGGRVFCGQSVGFTVAPRAQVPAQYRRFLGVWADAAWGPDACAALVVEDIDQAGTATILYVFGPLSSSTRGPGGVLHGTGVVRDGMLRFQNSDGTQFAFRPQIADLAGHMTTPHGDSFDATFKKSF